MFVCCCRLRGQIETEQEMKNRRCDERDQLDMEYIYISSSSSFGGAYLPNCHLNQKEIMWEREKEYIVELEYNFLPMQIQNWRQ
jgi:hypothetical protein